MNNGLVLLFFSILSKKDSYCLKAISYIRIDILNCNHDVPLIEKHIYFMYRYT